VRFICDETSSGRYTTQHKKTLAYIQNKTKLQLTKEINMKKDSKKIAATVLLRHYHEPVTQAEAVAFWAAFPAPPSPAGLEADAVIGCS
jgi:hypothetical protein